MKKNNFFKLNLPDKIFGIEKSLLMLFLPPLGLIVLFFIILNLVLVPKIDEIGGIKDKINEVNLLNAKLLYSNKLFKSHNLNENQKMKVIENFDRAVSLREVKLVYSTLAESFKQPVAKKVVKESFASRPVASTKPSSKTVLTEGTELANRFKKLAGLI